MNETRDAFVVPTSLAEGRDELGPTARVQQLRSAMPLRPVTPQCEANRTNRYLSDEYGAGRTRPLPQCSHSSSYVINGAHYCKRHAGDVALKLLLEQSAAKQQQEPGELPELFRDGAVVPRSPTLYHATDVARGRTPPQLRGES